jgi:hypothetical protein
MVTAKAKAASTKVSRRVVSKPLRRKPPLVGNDAKYASVRFNTIKAYLTMIRFDLMFKNR